LLDFGIAALLGPEDTSLTREAAPGLTPEYAAPEQVLGEPVTTATDVYALGLVLFVLLTGKHPLGPEGKSAPEIARATLDLDPPPASAVVGEPRIARALRGDLDNIVARALKKDPQERYHSAEALAEDLRRYLANEPVSARPDSLAYRLGKFVRRHRGSVAAGVFSILVLIAATVTTTLQMLEARRQRDEASYQSQRAEFQARFAHLIMSEIGQDGRPVTIRELMQKGVEVLKKNYGDDPRFVIGMLVNISGRYMDLGDTGSEYATLLEAERIARQLGDPERIAYVQCNTVETEIAAGRRDKAEERLRDGLAHLAMLSEPSFERQTDCGAAQARLLWAQGDIDSAVEIGSRVASLYERSGRADDLGYQALVSLLDTMLSEAGRRREAYEWQQRGMLALERAGLEGTMSMSAARHNQAAHLYAAGEVRAALDLQRKIVEPIETHQGPDAVSPGHAIRMGLYMVRIEETEAGL